MFTKEQFDEWVKLLNELHADERVHKIYNNPAERKAVAMVYPDKSAPISELLTRAGFRDAFYIIEVNPFVKEETLLNAGYREYGKKRVNLNGMSIVITIEHVNDLKNFDHPAIRHAKFLGRVDMSSEDKTVMRWQQVLENGDIQEISPALNEEINSYLEVGRKIVDQDTTLIKVKR